MSDEKGVWLSQQEYDGLVQGLAFPHLNAQDIRCRDALRERDEALNELRELLKIPSCVNTDEAIMRNNVARAKARALLAKYGGGREHVLEKESEKGITP